MLFKGIGGTDKKRRRRDGDYVGHTWIVNVVSGISVILGDLKFSYDLV